ncbi:hypothetical protein H7H37_22815, partial [Mycolicibacterium insubricum]|nr:hypothetical protein [Mycolicibacterium insubricum]
GSIIGTSAVGLIAQHASFSWAFVISAAILLTAAGGWVLAPETQKQKISAEARALASSVISASPNRVTTLLFVNQMYAVGTGRKPWSPPGSR